jgi:transmembrane sensor
MTAETPDPIDTQAIAWHICLRDGGDDDWARFAQWLEQDPRHAAAYDHIAAADHDLEALLPDLRFHEAANDDAPPVTPRRWRWPVIGGAVAAALVLALTLRPGADRYDVVTGPGEHRLIALDTGTQVELNGATRMTFDHKNPRFAELHGGEALFHVRHDAARPFALTVAGRSVVDLGTVFDVVHDDDGIRLAVAEGKVAYRPAGQSVTVAAGQALTDARGDGPIRVVPVLPAAVGGWHDGRLVYDGAPLNQVAADIARTLGLRVDVAPGLEHRTVSGALTLHGKGPAEARRIGAVLDVAVVVGADRWTLRAP